MTPRPARIATMNEVAAAAGVSQATVSLVLNKAGGSRVAEATRQRVLEAAEELGYRPNAAAKTLRKGAAGLIGFVGDVVASSPFAGRIVEGAQARAWDDGMLLLTVNTGGDERLEAAAIDALLAQRVAGIVYASMYHRRLTVPEALEGLPTVVLNSEDAAGRARAVVPDEFEGGRAATRALLEAGHRRIAMINIETLASGLPAAVGRHDGYRSALGDAGVAYDRRLVREGDGNPQGGFDHTLALMSAASPPTAIFCANDRTAWGAYQALETLGLEVPRDVSIVGFDNQETLAPFLRPGLTTLGLPFVEMGRRAVDLLLGGHAADEIPERIECPLIERGSVAAPRGGRVG
ncbi:LacI family DNA-binding transcriptional regulator [Agromyces aurantiacus]|uniref:LacI family DNA-binding transcriptional regulator n=1 Tax=Agromyces aurantiacus TaxID=165814 RepID=A0ABV9R2J3_9MICO|nr:LacI family DNA-binding transcriptional regulator [Agromyces aurantiacus]MBM7505895.1 LacI family transcriptional regulator [Agromyces aurantiacus]